MKYFHVTEWLRGLLRREPAGGTPAGELDLRLHDADGAQLAQRSAVMHDELESLAETAVHAPADLGLASERRRGTRAQARRRIRKPR